MTHLIGTNKARDGYSVIRMAHNPFPSHLKDIMDEDPHTLNHKQMADYVRNIGRVEIKFECCGIIGFIRFMQGYYAIFCTNRKCVAKIKHHKIYEVEDVILLPLYTHCNTNFEAEIEYLKIFKSNDLTQDIFFSYTYNIAQSLQHNMLHNSTLKLNWDNRFVWNYYLLSEFAPTVNNQQWVFPVIQGYVHSQQYQYADYFSIVLISRRCRRYAGPRYWKRGINEIGDVANCVETEQIVLNESKSSVSGLYISSYLQIRGSIPMFWSQQSDTYSVKPPVISKFITIVNNIPSTLSTVFRHFGGLILDYGAPIMCIDLTKSKDKDESKLSRYYQEAISYINLKLNSECKIYYGHLDFKRIFK